AFCISSPRNHFSANSLLASQEAVELRPPANLGPSLVPRRGQRSHRQFPVEVLGDLRLGLGGLLPEERVEPLELGVYPRRVHRGWHRRRCLTACELQAKPLEGTFDLLKLAPDGSRFPTLGQEPDQVARLTFHAQDLGLQVLHPSTPLPESCL